MSEDEILMLSFNRFRGITKLHIVKYVCSFVSMYLLALTPQAQQACLLRVAEQKCIHTHQNSVPKLEQSRG